MGIPYWYTQGPVFYLLKGDYKHKVQPVVGSVVRMLKDYELRMQSNP